MSLTKRNMDATRDAKRAEEKENCGCYFNFDDKFEVLCPEHEEGAAFEQWKDYRDYHDSMLELDNEPPTGEIADGVLF